MLASHAVPLIGFLLIGGVWADRLPRHLVVVTTDLIRFTLHALLATLIFTGAVEICTSSEPTTTTGNSNPLAWWMVITCT